jgi:hypothetical protein
MCFSATASFASGLTLLAVGAVAVRSVSQSRDLAYSLIPTLFGVQQLIEGTLWLNLGTSNAAWRDALTLSYTLFSHVLWPIYVPLCIWLTERSYVHRRRLAALSVMGFVVGTYLLLSIVRDPISAYASGRHIVYASNDPHNVWVMIGYLLSTCLSGMISSQRVIRVFGYFTLMSFAIAYALYTTWFISVWCFFAALLSVSVLQYCLRDRRHRSGASLLIRKHES